MNVVSFLFFMSAPLVLIPLFRASTTGDGARVIICCFGLPVMIETIGMFMRFNKGDSYDQELKHESVIQQQIVPYLCELILVMLRRMLIGGIVDPQYATIAILITGIEEALLRCTLMERDLFIRSFFTDEPPSDEQMEYQKGVWAVTIMNTMQAELIAIILCR